MEVLDPTGCLMMEEDFLLDVSLEGEEEEEEEGEDDKTKALLSSSSSKSDGPDDHNRPFPEFAEEELEWLSNKDAFPALDTCFGIITSSLHSPVSVLDMTVNAAATPTRRGGLRIPANHPVRARSKRRRTTRKEFRALTINRSPLRDRGSSVAKKPARAAAAIGRRCHHCMSQKTPQWRAGPTGPKTLCNACGVRYKSGRLVPEYRPASSPTFSSLLHSNSHRKVLEMRRSKQMGGVTVSED